MSRDPKKILSVLDGCCNAFTFPMLDNGYVYLAASRLSAHYSESDWAIVIEIFGYSPRSGFPDLHVHTFASKLNERDPREGYVSEEAYRRYLATNPNNESRFFFPIEGELNEKDDDEFVSNAATRIYLRNLPIVLPAFSEYASHGIELTDSPRVRVFELCRYLAYMQREKVLATVDERRISVRPEMKQILQLEEWHHPDLLENERPSTSVTFQQIASVLASGDSSKYQPNEPPNTHWSNWPEGGTL